MSITVEGTIQRIEMGTGTWALVATDGQTYELHQGAPAALLQAGQTVKVEGDIRSDVMTLAAIGAVLEVKTFDVIQ
ncbi:MAG: hypothetical protein HC925_09630 [Coleofasciculaceae cyanobacterium SM2_3_26]|nr:hypothetical protein [Coleofasciculaceae cyanobacterium SM2_3_26]